MTTSSSAKQRGSERADSEELCSEKQTHHRDEAPNKNFIYLVELIDTEAELLHRFRTTQAFSLCSLFTK